jgi:hypothetical protein
MPKTPDELDGDDGDERWMEMEEEKGRWMMGVRGRRRKEGKGGWLGEE